MNNNIPTREEVERRRAQYPPHTRVELVSMADPYTTLKAGDRGFVTSVDNVGTVHIRWDNGSMLGAAYGADEIKATPFVNDTIYKQVMEIRAKGQVNMFDTTAVHRYAYEHGMFDLVTFMDEHKNEYVGFIFHGKRESDA